jgi:hypothetical protein
MVLIGAFKFLDEIPSESVSPINTHIYEALVAICFLVLLILLFYIKKRSSVLQKENAEYLNTVINANTKQLTMTSDSKSSNSTTTTTVLFHALTNTNAYHQFIPTLQQFVLIPVRISLFRDIRNMN